MAKTISMEPTRYVLKFEAAVPKEEQTTWFIRPLDWRERAEVQDGMLITEVNINGPKEKSQTSNMKYLTGTQRRIAVERGLVKVENLHDHNNELVHFDSTSTAEQRLKVYNMIPPRWADELADEILRMSGLTKEEEKK